MRGRAVHGASTGAEPKLILARALTAAFFPVGWALSWLGRPGKLLPYFLPYAARHHRGRGRLRRQWHYCVLDTFDWYGPRHESPQTEQEVVEAMKKAGLDPVKRMQARGYGDRWHAASVLPASDSNIGSWC